MSADETAAIQRACLEKMKKGGLQPMERMDCFDEFELTNPNTEAVEAFYDVWAADYDTDMAHVSYKNPVDVANVLSKYVSDANRKTLTILDVGAGTGTGGVKLKEAGFANIDATDGSPGMLKLAAQLGVYRNVHPHEVLIQGLPMKTIAPETYDIVTSSGAFYPFHLQGGHLSCFIDCVKAGGFVVISASPADDSRICLRPVIKDLVDRGVVELLEETHIPKWYREDDGTVWALRKRMRLHE